MMRKFYTRLQLQEILEKNPLKAEVAYHEREDDTSPGNYIVYNRLSPNGSIRADDRVHMRRVLVQVTHLHKAKLESIEDFMQDHFGVEPVAFDVKQLDTNYLGTYYRFEIFTKGRW